MDDKASSNQKLPYVFDSCFANTPNAAVIADLLAKEPKKEFRDAKFEMAIYSQKLQMEIVEKLDALIENSDNSSKLANKTFNLSKKAWYVALLTLIVAFMTLIVSVCIPLRSDIMNMIKRIRATSTCSSAH